MDRTGTDRRVGQEPALLVDSDLTVVESAMVSRTSGRQPRALLALGLVLFGVIVGWRLRPVLAPKAPAAGPSSLQEPATDQRRTLVRPTDAAARTWTPATQLAAADQETLPTPPTIDSTSEPPVVALPGAAQMRGDLQLKSVAAVWSLDATGSRPNGRVWSGGPPLPLVLADGRWVLVDHARDQVLVDDLPLTRGVHILPGATADHFWVLDQRAVNQTARRVDAATLALGAPIEVPWPIRAAVGDGFVVSAPGENAAEVWYWSPTAGLLNLVAGRLGAVRLDTAGDAVLVVGNGAIEIHDVVTGEQRRVDGPDPASHDPAYLCWSPDGRFAAIGAERQIADQIRTVVTVVDVATGRTLAEVPTEALRWIASDQFVRLDRDAGGPVLVLHDLSIGNETAVARLAAWDGGWWIAPTRARHC